MDLSALLARSWTAGWRPRVCCRGPSLNIPHIPGLEHGGWAGHFASHTDVVRRLKVDRVFRGSPAYSELLRTPFESAF